MGGQLASVAELAFFSRPRRHFEEPHPTCYLTALETSAEVTGQKPTRGEGGPVRVFFFVAAVI